MLAIAQDNADDALDADLDRGPRKVAAGTERLCAATGSVKPVADMIRFVVGPDGAVVPDLKQKLPGRGVWVTATRAALTTALARKAFARSFRREVKAPAEIVELTDRLLERAALDALAMAHKARRVVTGFVRVENALLNEPVAVLIHASDAALDGVRKLEAARRHAERDIPVHDGYSSAQLDLALGRPNVIHAALLAGPESDTYIARSLRLARFRADAAPTRPTKN
jgi:predicted RNA-binding protein YlxR (DUF448 family)